MPEFTAARLADVVNGELVGPGDVTVRNVRALEMAGPRDIAFVRDDRALAAARESKAGVLVASGPIEGYGGTVIVCADPELAMAAVLEMFATERLGRPPDVSPQASVSGSARVREGAVIGHHAFVGDNTVIGAGAVIYPLVYIGHNCTIGPRTIICPHVSVHDRTRIGADCIIHYNAVIGAEGFGFLQRGGKNVKLPQIGGVRIGNRVEVGAHTSIDRAMVEETVIGDGVKIDNHCQIAHNCRIGVNCIMAGYSRMAGSVTLGKGVIVAADVGIKDHVTIGDGAVLGVGTGVHTNVPAGAVMLGYPARPISEARRVIALTGRLPKIVDRVHELERMVRDLGDSGPETLDPDAGA